MSRLAGAALVVIVLAVAAGGAYFYLKSITTRGPPAQFNFSLSQPFMHVSPGTGRQILVFVERSRTFSDSIRVELANPPSWVAFRPFTINATTKNATMIVGATQNAPKTAVTLTVHASSADGGYQEALLDLKVVGVATVTSEYGAAEVYDTTKILDKETLQALTSYSNDAVVFAKTTSLLQTLERGDVIASPLRASPIVPHGFLRTVLSVRQEGVSVVVGTQQAMMIDAVRWLDVKSPKFPIGGSVASGSGSSDATSASFSPTKSFDIGPVNLAPGGNVVAEAHLAFDAGPTYHYSIDCGLFDGCDVDFGLHLAVYQKVDLSLKGKAGSVLNWQEANLGTIYEAAIPILDGFLWIEIKVTLQGGASGILQNNLDINYHEYFGFEVGPDYDDGWHWYEQASGFPPSVEKSGTIEGGSGSDAKIAFGPRLEGSVNGRAGVYVTAHFFAVLKSEIPHRPSWWVDAGIDFRAGLWVDLWIWGAGWDGGPWTLWSFRLFDGWNIQPKITITAPQDGTSVDLSKQLFLPQYAATAFDPEDGDLCAISGRVLWTSSLDGNMAAGCSGLLGFKHAGTHVVTATATDTDGKSSSAKITLMVILATPSVTISQPLPNAQFYTGATVTLRGFATLPPSPDSLPCDKLKFTVQKMPGPAFVYQAKPWSPPYCEAQAAFNNPGIYQITLTAISYAGIEGSASVMINVVQPPANPPPVATIILPVNGHTYLWSNDVIPLLGNAYDPDGEPITSITWYVIYYPYRGLPVKTVVAKDTLSTNLYAKDYCSRNIPISIRIQLVATDPSGTGESQVMINLTCVKPLASPPNSGPFTYHAADCMALPCSETNELELSQLLRYMRFSLLESQKAWTRSERS